MRAHCAQLPVLLVEEQARNHAGNGRGNILNHHHQGRVIKGHRGAGGLEGVIQQTYKLLGRYGFGGLKLARALLNLVDGPDAPSSNRPRLGTHSQKSAL